MKTVTLGEIAEFVMGQAPPGASCNQDKNGTPFVKAGEFGVRRPIIREWTTSPLQFARETDVLVCVVGATAGKLNLGLDCAIGRSVCAVRPQRGRLDQMFAYHFLRTQTLKLRGGSQGSAQGVITRGMLENLPVPDMPVAEQRRIADILDKADTIRRKRKEAVALTEELLRSAFLEMFGDPVTNPKGWPLRPLGDLLDGIDSGWSPVCEARPANDDEWGVLKLGAVTFGRYNPSETKALAAGLSPVPELEVRAGDVLFSRKNTYDHVAACVFVTDTRPKLMLPDLIFRLVLSRTSGLLPETLWALLSNERMRKKVQGLAGGTAGSMPNISKERLRTVNLPVPPRAVQGKFAAAMRGSESTRAALDAAARESEILFNSLVARAFSGGHSA